jgi:hypothetical protein
MRKSVIWMPVLLVGAMVYWTLALGFGGLSLMSLTSDCVPYPDRLDRDSYQSIRVNLGDGPEAAGDDVTSVTVDLVSDHEAARVDEDLEAAGAPGAGGQDARGSGRRSRTDRGPGETAF